jgi:hypothetical protein
MMKAAPTRFSLQAYSDSERKSPVGSKINCTYKADSLRLTLGNCVSSLPVIGEISGGTSYQKGRNARLQVTLLLQDMLSTPLGSLAGKKASSLLKDFLAAVYRIDGSQHRPNLLTARWADLPLGDDAAGGFKCFLQQLVVRERKTNYQGETTSIELDCDFVEMLSPKAIKIKAQLQSPDLTHVRQVNAGDRLDQKTWQIYQSSRLMLPIAALNRLDQPRELDEGRMLRFPPYQGAA